jgi:cytochrome c5
MTPSAKSTPLAVLLLTLGIFAVWDAPQISAADNSTATAGGLTLQSVGADFPDPGRLFPGGDSADAINNNCLACHSAGMVLTQPKLSRAEWQAEVNKMRDTYKAPVGDEDVPAIVDYLVNRTSGK